MSLHPLLNALFVLPLLLPAPADAAETGGAEAAEDGAEAAGDGAEAAEGGSVAVEDGAETADDGAEAAEDGAEAVDDGAEAVEDGAEAAEDGAETAEDGAEAVDDGAEAVDDGAEETPVAEEAPIEEEAPVEEAVPDEAAEDEASEEEDEEAPLIDDLSSPFFYVGGGAGAVLPHKPIQPEPLARLSVGAGFYVPMLYLAGGLDVSFRRTMPLMIDGYGAAGISIPTPVFHPLIGFKIGAGAHYLQGAWGGHLVYGPQIGWLIRGYDKKVGFRAVVEPQVHYFAMSGTVVPEIVLTLSLVL